MLHPALAFSLVQLAQRHVHAFSGTRGNRITVGEAEEPNRVQDPQR
ncbi:hypothetical protein FM103_06730 [Corynebacterium xerosis]|nr:hypothetical protein FM103_06730 [Corynebacterium xerosis]